MATTPRLGITQYGADEPATLDALNQRLNQIDSAVAKETDFEAHVADTSLHGGNVIDDTATSTTKTFSANKINTLLGGKSDTSHVHDDRYPLKQDLINGLATKANSSHIHDERYYTEQEIDDKLSAISSSGGSSSNEAIINQQTISVVGTPQVLDVIIPDTGMKRLQPELLITRAVPQTSVTIEMGADDAVRFNATGFIFDGKVKQDETVILNPSGWEIQGELCYFTITKTNYNGINKLEMI